MHHGMDIIVGPTKYATKEEMKESLKHQSRPEV